MKKLLLILSLMYVETMFGFAPTAEFYSSSSLNPRENQQAKQEEQSLWENFKNSVQKLRDTVRSKFSRPSYTPETVHMSDIVQNDAANYEKDYKAIQAHEQAIQARQRMIKEREQAADAALNLDEFFNNSASYRPGFTFSRALPDISLVAPDKFKALTQVQIVRILETPGLINQLTDAQIEALPEQTIQEINLKDVLFTNNIISLLNKPKLLEKFSEVQITQFNKSVLGLPELTQIEEQVISNYKKELLQNLSLITAHTNLTAQKVQTILPKLFVDLPIKNLNELFNNLEFLNNITAEQVQKINAAIFMKFNYETLHSILKNPNFIEKLSTKQIEILFKEINNFPIYSVSTGTLKEISQTSGDYITLFNAMLSNAEFLYKLTGPEMPDETLKLIQNNKVNFADLSSDAMVNLLKNSRLINSLSPEQVAQLQIQNIDPNIFQDFNIIKTILPYSSLEDKLTPEQILKINPAYYNEFSNIDIQSLIQHSEVDIQLNQNQIEALFNVIADRKNKDLMIILLSKSEIVEKIKHEVVVLKQVLPIIDSDVFKNVQVAQNIAKNSNFVEALTNEQIIAMPKEFFQNLLKKNLEFLLNKPDLLKELTEKQVQAINPEVLSQVLRDKVPLLPTEFVEKLSAKQIAQLLGDHVEWRFDNLWKNLNTKFKDNFSPQDLQWMKEKIERLRNIVQSLLSNTEGQSSNLQPNKETGTIVEDQNPAEAWDKLNIFFQNSNLNKRDFSSSQLPDIRYIAPDKFKTLTEDQIRFILQTPVLIKQLTNAQIAALPDTIQKINLRAMVYAHKDETDNILSLLEKRELLKKFNAQQQEQLNKLYFDLLIRQKSK